MRTVLSDRTLWFDGKMTIEPSNIHKFIRYADSGCLAVDEETPEIKQYNKLIPEMKRIVAKEFLTQIPNDWTIPKGYQDLNVESFITETHDYMLKEGFFEASEMAARTQRIDLELRLFKKHDLFPLLQALIYVINTLKQHNQVWGTGRGSSVSSYILFILEVHDVDSYAYGLEITDFIK